MRIPTRDEISRAFARGRTALYRFGVLLRMEAWFPHLPLALLFVLGGFWLLARDLGTGWPWYLKAVVEGDAHLPPHLLPVLLVGGGMISVGLGLLLRSRVAWTMALLLALTGAAVGARRKHQRVRAAGVFHAVAVALLVAWRRSTAAAWRQATLVRRHLGADAADVRDLRRVLSGTQFKPEINEMITAYYYALVTMSTVGYGDITPQTPRSQAVRDLGHHPGRGGVRHVADCGHRADGQQSASTASSLERARA